MLYIVATPIGNLEDITLRALRVLGEVDFIAAEDTRRTIKLLNHYDIKTKLLSFHEHSDRQKREQILGMLQEGKDVALVSDAGTPLISDPGAVLVSEAYERGIEVTTLPGACAAIAALTLSGHGGQFFFSGFLPKKAGERQREIDRIAKSEIVSVVYESPHALERTLKQLSEACGGDRRITAAKEITKLHESVFTGSIDEARKEFEGGVKGEFVLIIDEAEKQEVSDEQIKKLIEKNMKQGMTKKDAANAASRELGIRPNRAYRLTI